MITTTTNTTTSITITTTTTTTIATTTIATAAATTTTTTAILGLLHGNLTARHVTPVDLLDRLARLFLRRHLDEAEAARTAGFTVRHDLRVGHGAEPAEKIAQVQLGDGVGQISNVESRSHVFLVAVM
jgi:hypothetical protein